MNERGVCQGRREGVRTMKRRTKLLLWAVLALMAGWAVYTGVQQRCSVITLENPLGAQGTISFRIQTDQEYHTGKKVKSARVDILDIPGIATVRFSQSSTVCELQWLWARGVKADDLMVEMPGLPGPEEYFIQYTWDAAAGRFAGYVNGTALRLAETQLEPWKARKGRSVRVAEGPFKTTLVSTEPRYLDETQARAQVPGSMLGKHAELFGVRENGPAPMDIAARQGKLLYASALDAPGSTGGWVMEGLGTVSFKDGWMEMASKDPDSIIKDGHLVYWCPRDFPESFVAEWEMQITSPTGLCIVFFASRGLNGEDIFDPGLPKRTGVFAQYNQGAISCYNISY